MVDWIADIPFEVLLEALQHAMVDKSTTDKNRGLLVKMADELEEFLQKVFIDHAFCFSPPPP